jgi:hypothetical protein
MNRRGYLTVESSLYFTYIPLVFTQCLFSVQESHLGDHLTSPVSCRGSFHPSGCGTFSDFPHFWWPWQSAGVVFVDCPWMAMSQLDTGVMGLQKKDQRGKVLFSYEFKGTCYPWELGHLVEVMFTSYIHCKVTWKKSPSAVVIRTGKWSSPPGGGGYLDICVSFPNTYWLNCLC